MSWYRIWEMWSFTFGWCQATKSNFVRARHTGQNFRPRYVRTFYTPYLWSCEFFRDEKWGEICTGLGRLQSSYISYGRPTSLENSWSQCVWINKNLMLIFVRANFVLCRHRRSISKIPTPHSWVLLDNLIMV